MKCSMPGFPAFHSRSLLKFMSIELAMPSNHLNLCRPLLLLPSSFPRIRVFSNELALCIKWPKFWSFSTSPSNDYSSEYSGLISFRMDWFDLLAIQGTLKSLLQQHGWKASIFSNTIVQKHQFSPIPQFKSIDSLVLSFLYSPTLTSVHDYWKNPSFD